MAFGEYLHRREVIRTGRKDAAEWSTAVINKQRSAKYSDPAQTAGNSQNILNNSGF